MSQHRPPEGRRDKHHKPLIPVSTKPAQRIEQRQPSLGVPGSVVGVGIARRLLFETTIDRPSWHMDMLVALYAAKQLGIQQFEITIDGQPLRPQPQSSSIWYFGGGPDEGETWKAPKGMEHAKISIYAVVIE